MPLFWQIASPCTLVYGNFSSFFDTGLSKDGTVVLSWEPIQPLRGLKPVAATAIAANPELTSAVRHDVTSLSRESNVNETAATA